MASVKFWQRRNQKFKGKPKFHINNNKQIFVTWGKILKEEHKKIYERF